MTKVQRYKVGFFQDEWGLSGIAPRLIPDDSGFAVKFEDYCKLEAENERLKHNLVTTEQTMREYQELAAKRLEEIERLKEIKMAGEIMRDHGDDIATQEAVADARAAIASVKGEQ